MGWKEKEDVCLCASILFFIIFLKKRKEMKDPFPFSVYENKCAGLFGLCGK